MLLQVLFASLFLFLGVRRMAGTAAALFAATWLLHTRNVIERMTGGLPRGWATGVLCCFLYFLLSRNHKGVLFSIFIGCLLHPPSTFLIAATYGVFLLWQLVQVRTRANARRPLLTYLALCPLFFVLALFVVDRPDSIGSMATLEVASEMPEFSRPGGRFEFLPFKGPWEEIRAVAFQAFVPTRWYYPPSWFVETLPFVLGLALAAFGLIARKRQREIVPSEIVFFGLSIVAVYFLSRVFAFHLYVPDRHLQFPAAVFFISAFSIAAVRATGTPLLGLCFLAGVIFFGSLLESQWEYEFQCKDR